MDPSCEADGQHSEDEDAGDQAADGNQLPVGQHALVASLGTVLTRNLVLLAVVRIRNASTNFLQNYI